MSSGRQTGHRLGGWGARPEEGAEEGLRGPNPAAGLQDWPGQELWRAGRDADLGRASGDAVLAGAWWGVGEGEKWRWGKSAGKGAGTGMG